MSKYKSWSESEYFLLGNLIEAGFTNREISEMMNKPLSAIAIKSHRVFKGNPNYRIKKTIHKHLRGPVMEYFVTHTWDETKARFRLSDRHLKSIFTAGYKDPKYAHLRKETRTHEPWSTKQLLFLIRHSGLRPRNWIADKLKRGNAHSCIKERLERLGIASRTLNGLTLSSYRSIFEKEPRVVIKTDAGPGRGKFSATYFKIVPWVQVKRDLKEKYVTTRNVPLKKSVETMAMFQEWIHGKNALNKIQQIVKRT